MAEDKIIIDIEVSNDNAAAAIIEAQKEIKRLRQEQDELTDAYARGLRSQEQYTKELKSLNKSINEQNAVIKANEKVIADNDKEMGKHIGSLNEMREQLKRMLKDYDNLSRSERENADVGGALLQKIQQQTAAVNEAEQATGRFQRNVGNYPKVFDLAGTSMGRIGAMFNTLSQGTGNLSVAMGGAKQAVAAFGKQLLELLENPIVAIISAIVVVFMRLVEAFKRSDDAMTSLQSAMAAFQPIITAVRIVLEKVAEVLGKIVEGAAKAVTAILRLIPAFKEAQDGAMGLVKAEDQLQEKEREYTVESAKNNKEVAELRAKAMDREKYSAAEREKFLQKAIDLQGNNLKTEKEIAAERYRIAKEKAKQDRDTTDETKQHIAELEAAMYEAEEKYFTGVRSLQKEAQRARNEEAKAEQDALRERQQKYKEYLQKRKEQEQLALQWARAYEDARIEAIADAKNKEEEALRTSYTRQIEDLKRTLKDEKNLTQQARKDINALIILKEAEMQTKIGEMRDKWSKEQAAKRREEYLKWISEGYKALSDNLTLQLKRDLQAAGDSAVDAAQAYVDAAQRNLDRLKEIDQKTGIERAQFLEALGMTEDQFSIARIDAENAVTDALEKQKKVNKELVASQFETTQKTKMAYMNMVSTITGSLSDMMNELAEDNEAMQGFLKAIAMANVAANTAASIAGAVNAAVEAGGFTGPAAVVTIPTFIATLVATVTAAIAQTASLLKKADAPKAPKFAEGGLVGDTFSERTDDTVNAKLSIGESVMTSRATKAAAPLLSAINQMYGGAPIGGGSYIAESDIMRDMMRDAMAEVQPVVSVKEITRVSNRVRVKETIAKN